MALTTEPGAATADSYATLAEATAYHQARLHADAWSSASDATREAALKEACRLLDATFTWTGAAAGAGQALCWPRTGMLNRNGFPIASTVVPLELKHAQAEFARQLIAADRAADHDAVKQGIASVKAGSVTVEFKRSEIASDTDVQARDVDMVDRIVPDAVRLLLVPSWYTRRTIARSFMFGNL